MDEVLFEARSKIKPLAALFWLTISLSVSVQAINEISGDVFTFSYCDGWVSQDENTGSIVNFAYALNGAANNYDSSSLASLDLLQNHLSEPRILYPNGGETLNGTVTVQWIISTDSFDHPVTYSVYFSATSGTTWTLVASKLINIIYDWDTKAVVTGSTYRLKVVANSSSGLTAEDISDSDFTIINSTPPRITIPMTLLESMTLLGLIPVELSILVVFFKYTQHKVQKKGAEKSKEHKEQLKAQFLAILQKIIDENKI
ncbi:MAG: hypothetical protein ACFFBD_04855 [Candidatus Hodarchaeota archaeon]